MCQPGRPSAGRGLPGRLPRALAAPDQGVERVLLAGPVRVAAALGEQLEHLGLRQARHAAEVRVGVHGQVGVGLDLVGGAALAQTDQEVVDQRDRLDRADVVLGGEHLQRGHVLAEQFGLAQRQVPPVLAVALGPLQQRVVDVGDVLHVVHGDARVAHGAAQQVEGDVGVRVPEVGGVVRGDPADVHPELGTGRGRDELAGGGVPDPDRQALAGQPGNLRGGPGVHGFTLFSVGGS